MTRTWTTKLLPKKRNGCFEDRFDDRLNENNWNHQECLVLSNGRLVNLQPDRDELFREAEQLPPDKRYKWARLMALQCVASQHELCRQTCRDDFDSLISQIMLEVPPRLAAL